MGFSGTDQVRAAIHDEGWDEVFSDRCTWVFKKLGANPQSQNTIELHQEEGELVLFQSGEWGARPRHLSVMQPDLGEVRDFLYEAGD